MTSYSGTAGIVQNNAGTTIGEIKEWTLDLNMNVPEVTAFGEEASRYIPGIRSGSGSFSGNHSDNAAMIAFQEDILTGDANIFVLRLWINATIGFNMNASMEGVTPGVSFDGAATQVFSFSSNDIASFVN